MIFLGVDGGGTKTALMLVSSDGAVLARHRTTGSYRSGPPGVGPRHVAEVLGRGVGELCSQVGIDATEIDYAFFGLPAYGELAEDDPLLDELPRTILHHDHYRCDNDAVCGWAGSLGLADGINVVAGTGSIAYGHRHDRGTRCGGWGELFGDEGSGYWIGLQALQVFSQVSDGRMPSSELHRMLRSELGFDRDLELLDVVLHRWGSDRVRIAALSTLVAEAADAGDAAASTILQNAANELVRLVDAVTARLGAGDESMLVSYSGGVFKSPLVLQRFTTALAERRHRLQAPLYEPVVGAALYAAELAGHPLNTAARQRLSADLT